jgi:hypothetical protein
VRRHAGFSLDAAVLCGASDSHPLKQRRRYITRPALANERADAAPLAKQC